MVVIRNEKSPKCSTNGHKRSVPPVVMKSIQIFSMKNSSKCLANCHNGSVLSVMGAYSGNMAAVTLTILHIPLSPVEK